MNDQVPTPDPFAEPIKIHNQVLGLLETGPTNDTQAFALHIHNFIRNRISEILTTKDTSESNPPNTLIIQRDIDTLPLPVSGKHTGLFVSTDCIAAGPLYYGCKMDDPDIYLLLAAMVLNVQNNEPENETEVIKKVINDIFKSVYAYFGIKDPRKVDQDKLEQFYTQLSSHCSIAGLKRKNNGPGPGCVELHAVAHNLLTFMGFKSTFIVSGSVEIPNTIDGNMRAFIFIHGLNIVLDFAHPNYKNGEPDGAAILKVENPTSFFGGDEITLPEAFFTDEDPYNNQVRIYRVDR